MAHHTVRGEYAQLVGRLSQAPQGAPPSDLLYQILAHLFTARDAALVALLPQKPFTEQRAARVTRARCSSRRAPSAC